MNVFRGIWKERPSSLNTLSKFASSYHVVVGIVVLILLAIGVLWSLWSSNGHLYIAIVGPMRGNHHVQQED